jgi:ABC-type transport system involved in multi-copper enzyme maturation permease subunit
MSLLRLLVHAFVNTFGITQPSPREEVSAGRFIALMLLCVLLVLAAAVWLLGGAFTRSGPHPLGY